MLSQLSYDPICNIQFFVSEETTQTGLEPVTSAVTGRRSNQLSHWALKGLYTFKTTHCIPSNLYQAQNYLALYFY